jgi:hypothetical protein
MRKLDFARETALIKTGLLLSTAVFFFYTLAPDYRWVIPLQIMQSRLCWHLKLDSGRLYWSGPALRRRNFPALEL